MILPQNLLAAPQAYELWAETYDRAPNPMLGLEQRWLEPLLPDTAGLRVVDVGCGTGRWLDYFRMRGAATVIGLDSSRAMLARAAVRRNDNLRLLLADCCAIPLDNMCADLMLASFLPGYVRDISHFAIEMARICRSQGWLFISDVHPATEKLLRWERTFNAGDRKYTVATYRYEIGALIRQFEIAGFELRCFLEPVFGDPELRMLEENGQRTADDLSSHPAIYIAGFCRLPLHPIARKPLTLTNGKAAIGPHESARVDLQVQGGKFTTILSKSAMAQAIDATSRIDLSGYLLFPGLINAHDHLEYALFPRMGSGPYKNAKEWADDIYHPDQPPIAAQSELNKTVRLLWGGVHNLLSGVTTVCHHNEFKADVFEREFPVSVVKNMGWSHSLYFDPDTIAKMEGSNPNHPFIIHLGEGADDDSAQEIFTLADAGALGPYTVIVHGIALNSRGLQLLRESGAALIWCPTSNCFLFGHTHAREAITDHQNVALGSDSPLTSAGDLLDEVRFACTSVGISAPEIYRQVTSSAARVLRLSEGQGYLRLGGVADCFAVRDRGNSPAERLAGLSAADVELVLLRGEIQLASAEILDRLSVNDPTHGLAPLFIADRRLWVRAPLIRMFRDTYAALGTDWKLGGKAVRYGA
ncbi:MAG: methyltransferase domain-containing protein [Acidobacteriaceae bacterium]